MEFDTTATKEDLVPALFTPAEAQTLTYMSIMPAFRRVFEPTKGLISERVIEWAANEASLQAVEPSGNKFDDDMNRSIRVILAVSCAKESDRIRIELSEEQLKLIRAMAIIAQISLEETLSTTYDADDVQFELPEGMSDADFKLSEKDAEDLRQTELEYNRKQIKTLEAIVSAIEARSVDTTTS